MYGIPRDSIELATEAPCYEGPKDHWFEDPIEGGVPEIRVDRILRFIYHKL